jgi:imidazolonepropionase-like amidohydrolase
VVIYAGQPVDSGIVIEDVTVISAERLHPLRRANVLIRNGRIERVDNGSAASVRAKHIDGHGKFLIPGLIDSHVHVSSMGPLNDDEIEAHPELLAAYHAQLPRSYLAFGFTTLIDLDLREGTLDWFNATPFHPHLYHCGRGVHIAGGYGALRPSKNAEEAKRSNLVYETAEAKDWPSDADPRDFTPDRAVDRVVQAGGICVKTFVEPGFGGAAHWPVPSTQMLAALRNETRRRKLVYIIHANAVESWLAAIDAHADVIAHGLWHWPGNPLETTPPAEAADIINLAARSAVNVQPTLQALYGDESIFDRSLLTDPRLAEALPQALIRYLRSSDGQASARALADEYRQAIARLYGATVDPAKMMALAPERATATLRMMQAKKVRLLFGSDTPSNEGIGYPPALNGRLEMQRWYDAGIPLAQILKSATLDNAVTFHLDNDLGTIQAGKRADLLLLHANPLESIEAYDRIDTIFVEGTPISRKSLLPTN